MLDRTEFHNSIMSSAVKVLSALGANQVQPGSASEVSQETNLDEFAVWIGFFGSGYQGYMIQTMGKDTIEYITELFSKKYGFPINSRQMFESAVMELTNMIMAQTNSFFHDEGYRITSPQILESELAVVPGKDSVPITQYSVKIQQVEYRIFFRFIDHNHAFQDDQLAMMLQN